MHDTQQGTVALSDRGLPGDWCGDFFGFGPAFAGFRFPREVISVAVRWYLRYGLSYRDVEELLAEPVAVTAVAARTTPCGVSHNCRGRSHVSVSS
jgi:hypothetical protein